MAKYSDISLNKGLVTDKTAVLEAVDNILKTSKGERVFRREFGSNLEKFLFRQMSFTVSRLILNEILSSITKWDDRVGVSNETEVVPNYDKRAYEVYLKLYIKGLGETIEVTKELPLK